MAIEFVCPACGGTLQVGDDAAGRVIRCGGCMTALTVPGGDGRAAPPNPYEIDRPTSPPPPPRSAPNPPPDEPRRRDDPDDRYDDRPRRRRPPPPPPDSGRGVFFWLVIIGAVMLVGVVACCGGFMLLIPGAKWQKHESKDGGFRVEMPNKLQPDVAKAAKINLKDAKGKGVQSEGTVLLKRGAAQFIVFYTDGPSEKERANKKPAESDEQVAEKTVQQLLDAMQDNDQKGLPPIRKPTSSAGFDGQQVDFQARSGFYTARVIVADTRVYVVLAGGGVTMPNDPDVRRFLDSFEITKPELLAAGKDRAARAKQKADDDKAREERKARLQAEAEADDLNDAAETVGAAAIDAALSEAKPAKKLPVAPPLPLAPPPRPSKIEPK